MRANLEESVQTLRFANRAKSLKTKAIENVQLSSEEMELLIDTLKAEVKTLKA
jgi:hypothetical protein